MKSKFKINEFITSTMNPGPLISGDHEMTFDLNQLHKQQSNMYAAACSTVSHQ